MNSWVAIKVPTDDAWGRLCALSQLDATKHFSDWHFR